MSESAAIITYIGFGLTILSAAGLTWSLWSNHNSKDEYSRRLDGIRDVVDSNKAALENLQEAHPKTRSQATRDRRYRSESGGRAGTQQFIGTMSLLHRRSLSLDLSTLAKLYSHMEMTELPNLPKLPPVPALARDSVPRPTPMPSMPDFVP